MAYADLTAMTERFGERELIDLTDRATPPTGLIDGTAITTALSSAEAEINAALASRYTLPLNPVPTLITDMTCELARYFLYDNELTETVEKRANWARNQLRALSTGQNQLDQGMTVRPAAAQSWKPASVFGFDQLRGL
ncbi:gp436 family protein [Thalassospira marina]|nr:DUF1320 domain-containing protein [Thalassospira marina]